MVQWLLFIFFRYIFWWWMRTLHYLFFWFSCKIVFKKNCHQWTNPLTKKSNNSNCNRANWKQEKYFKRNATTPPASCFQSILEWEDDKDFMSWARRSWTISPIKLWCKCLDLQGPWLALSMVEKIKKI